MNMSKKTPKYRLRMKHVGPFNYVIERRVWWGWKNVRRYCDLAFAEHDLKDFLKFEQR